MVHLIFNGLDETNRLKDLNPRVSILKESIWPLFCASLVPMTLLTKDSKVPRIVFMQLIIILS